MGNVYQAGTLSGNPLAMIAGYTLLQELKMNPNHYTELQEKTAYLHKGLQTQLEKYSKAFTINRLGSMISIHFSAQPVIDFATASQADNAFFNRFFHAMLKRGIYLPPSAFESWFLNNALSYKDLDATINAAKESMEELLA